MKNIYMKNKGDIRIVITLIFVLIVLGGCVTGKDLVRDGQVSVQLVNSNTAYIEHVSIKQYGNEVLIMGTVKRKSSGRGVIHDQLILMLTSPNGDLIYKDYVSYHRMSRHNGEASFSLTINQIPQTGSVVQISPHDNAIE